MANVSCDSPHRHAGLGAAVWSGCRGKGLRGVNQERREIVPDASADGAGSVDHAPDAAESLLVRKLPQDSASGALLVLMARFGAGRNRSDRRFNHPGLDNSGNTAG